jgi:Asp-tRNA(Asn)/Glu-tRNA(Gln) amidotransferase A subunit family amidase
VVMSAIARPDGRDLSVSEIPFNWNAHLDVRKLRVGYLKDAFDETKDAVLKRNEEKTLAQMQSLGVKLVPVKVPEWTVDVSAIGVESAVFFDELVRSGRDKKMTNPGRANGFRSSRTIPAVEYLQSQRARMLMMMKLAEATADVDVYLAPTNTGAGPAAGRGSADAPPPSNAQRMRSPVQRHFTMANLACYPALAVPNGFTSSGSPGSVTFYARPFGEAELLAAGKAYQDAAGFHLQHPKLA